MTGGSLPYNKMNNGKYELQWTSNAYILQYSEDHSLEKPAGIASNTSLAVALDGIAYHSTCCSVG